MRNLYVVGKQYTRQAIYELLELPQDRRGGDWLNGYHRHQDSYYIFCNIGTAGRTGHDHDNRWDGERLVWHGKNGSHFGQETIQNIASGDYEVLVFYRSDARAPFVFAGHGSPVPHRDVEGPARIDWIFGSDEHPEAPLFTDEYPEGARFEEGTRVRVYVNRLERSRQARDACVRAHGSRCSVCEMDFESIYGDIGRGFIHVHHVTPISASAGAAQVDPVRDLVPVCPNCHAMLHRYNPPLEPTALRRAIAARREANND